MSVARTLIKLREFQAAGSADTLTYANESVTGTTVKTALDWLFAVIYPNTQDSVDITANLPLIGNTLNDYRIVFDDGDGKAAGYRWEQREGDVSPSWYKTHDMDWSNDAILSSFIDQTLDLYVSKYGRMDLDANGDPLTGIFEGQSIYGGLSTGHLTLHARSGDGSSAPGDQDGYIQFHGWVRPTYDNEFDLGAPTERFYDLYLSGRLKDGTNSLLISELQDAYDHSQTIVGNPHGTGYDDLSDQLGTLTVDGDASGSISLSTSGDKTLTITVADNSHSHDAATTITGLDTEVYEYLKLALVDNTEVTWIFDDGLETIEADLTIATIPFIDDPLVDTILTGNALGTNWDATPASVTLTGDVTGTANYSTAGGGWSIATTVASSDISGLGGVILTNKTFTATGGTVTATAHGLATGETVKMYGALITGEFTVTVINANSFTISDTNIDSGYYIPQGAQLLFNTATGNFNIAKEYEEIRLGELQGLTEDVLTQYVAKDGRSGGQTIKGGVSASEQLILESTANATKGTVATKDTFIPFTTAAYSGGWTGTDLGSATKKWNDLYMSGEAKGFRFENLGSLPSPSGTTVGKAVYFNSNLYVDTGAAYVKVGSSDISVVSKVANYTVTAADDVILCSGTFTVTLPPASGITKSFKVKNTGTGTITIDGDGSETIDGSTTYDIADQYHSISLVSNGANWFIV